VAELEPDFDLSEPDVELPVDLATEAAQPDSSGTSSGATSEGEAQFDMLRLFYLRGDSAGFEETARFMREHNPDPDLWRRVAEMGRMLSPENPLYADPSAPRMEFDLPDLHPPRPAESMVERDPEPDEFLFEAEDASSGPAAPAAQAERAPEPFEFEYGAPHVEEIATLGTPLPEAPSAEPEPEAAEAEQEPQAEPPRAPVEADSASAAHAGGPQDPVDTKLELAQAYLEMGDAEGAQHMLDEVLNEGDSRQKAEAMRLREQAGPAQRRA
jgi:pilus assembly protein FimV